MRAMPLVLAAALGAGVSTPRVEAQSGRPWKYDAEFGASVFFGASQQTAVLVRNRVDWSDERLEFSAAGGFDYGEAKHTEDGRFCQQAVVERGDERRLPVGWPCRSVHLHGGRGQLRAADRPAHQRWRRREVPVHQQ
jgi:hypothetical protein